MRATGPGSPRVRSRHRIGLLAALPLVVVASLLPPPVPRASATAASASSAASAQETGESRPGQATGQGEPGGHESEGLKLVSVEGEDQVTPGAGCRPDAPVRRFDVVAVNVEITVNRYLDYDPEGRMYVLAEDLDRVRDEERRNATARASGSEPAISVGLQGDAIQPLTLRVNQGDCLRVRLRNDLSGGEAASFHLHGSSLRVAATGEPATSTSPDAMVQPGRTTEFEWMVRRAEPEGTHYFHSEGDSRVQPGHGLFGAVIVEPFGSRHLDPLTGDPLRSGWAAVIVDPEGSDFREYALYYHEIGDELYQLLNRSERRVPLVDPTSGAYRPASRAMNYRSESFMNRLALQRQRQGSFDESVAYSSYAFGDPATPIGRSYLGDPAKQRVIHGGSETAHVHHLHGGAVRWPRQPGAEPTGFDKGLVKRPPLRPTTSERVDSQSVGPSESYDIENECGSGGCQQSVGDFLFHCHIAQHYFAGMWGIWRVYNTLQDGAASTDALPALAELPDRPGGVKPAVDSAALAGSTVDSYGRRTTITAQDLPGWVERQLPPPGVPRGDDASVLDWQRAGDRYLGEPETAEQWPGYQARAPGERPPLAFDPGTGKLAYPFLRPHLGRRPPFAPNHGPAPFLDPSASGTDPPRPGANGPGGLCPTGTTPQTVNIQAISTPVTLNAGEGLVDPQGALFVLASQEAAVRADNARKVPLAIRANAGEDCVDVVLRSKLNEVRGSPARSKVSTHIHFVQFDIQASDGINTGFNYEQTVRPFTSEGERVVMAAAAGAASLRLGDAARFQPGVVVGVGMDQDTTFETARIAEVRPGEVVFDQPLRHPHAEGEIVSTEFVRYRWYPDAQTGTTYFHDHVNGLSSWKHGLFGALIVEPPGSTYHDPRTGAEIPSGPLADIRTEEPVSADVTGSFREAVLFLQDDNDLTQIDRSTGGSFNLRTQPLDGRTAADPSRRFSSADHGDPETPLIEANLGDPVVVRAVVGGTNEVHSLHVDGHWFRVEPWSRTSAPVDTVHLGISERYDLSIPRAGGPQQRPGDYLYYNGRVFKLREGSWGILRVRGSPGPGLQPLPGRPPVTPVTSATSVCPPGAPLRQFAVAAIAADRPMVLGQPGKMYVLQADKEAVRSGVRRPEPLVLHVNVGDCIKIELTNETRDGPVSFHAGMLASDPLDSGGVTAGYNPGQSVAVGETRTSTFYASPEVGETTALVRDFGDVLVNAGLGLYGAIVVGPEGARYRDPVTGKDASATASWKVDVIPERGPAYRDFSLLFQDEDEALATHRMPYSTDVSGPVGLNYHDASGHDDAGGVITDPGTPRLEAFAGDPVKVHVLAPWSEQAQVFSIEGHRWPFEPGLTGTNMVSSTTVVGMEAITAVLDGGAGGPERLAGDYVYGNHRGPYRQAGQWGLFRVLPPGADGATPLRPLPASCGAGTCRPMGVALPAGMAGAGFIALLGLGVAIRRRNGRPIRPE